MLRIMTDRKGVQFSQLAHKTSQYKALVYLTLTQLQHGYNVFYFPK